MKIALTIFSGLPLGMLAACVTKPLPYGPIGGERNIAFGYKDTHTGDGLYTLLVIIPESSKPTLAYEYWDRRAAELCGSANYKKNIFRAERPVVHYNYYGGRPGDFNLEGYLDCRVAAGSSK